MRNRSLVRVLTILRALQQGRRWTLYALAHRFDVHPRTIRRDLAALAAAGVPVMHDDPEPGQGTRGEWWICR